MSHHATNSYAVEATGLGKRFGRQWALAHCDLRVAPGDSVLLAGANGSGKTTLLRLVAGLYKPNEGRLRVYGHDPQEERLACRKTLSLVGHDHYLYSQMTALETVKLWSRLSTTSWSEDELMALLAEVELDYRSHYKVAGFSAGMKKRLTLLRTRIENPRLVLLDEPFSALDRAGQRLIEDWVQTFLSEGRTIMVASHNLPRAARLCDQAVYLKQGQIIWSGAADEMSKQMGGGS